MDERNAPATRGDLVDLETRLTERLEQRLTARLEESERRLTERLEQSERRLTEQQEMLRAESNHSYHDIIERISDSETRLLKAFYTYAQATNQRVTELEGNEAAIRSRLATLEDRILEVERRLNMPPAA